jgi:hypothetical protein
MKKIIYSTIMVACSLLTVNVFAQNDPSLTVGDTGTVSFSYRGNVVTYTTVRAADNKIWLQQNLGTSARATSATDINAYGDLFQWGRWDDGHQLRNSTTASPSTLSSNNPAGLGTGTLFFYTGSNPNDWWSAGTGTDTWAGNFATATNGIDPCTAIGPDWHMPSQTEWANIITLENITNVATGFASNLKLTAAGMRDGNLGTLLNVGLYGSYWTNTPSSIYAKDISILDNSVNNNDDALRSYGFSVRCMATCTGVFPPQIINGSDTVCGESMQTYSVPVVNNAGGYQWVLPAGWSISGSATGNTINVMTGNTGGTIAVLATSACGNSTPITMDVVVNPAPNPVITATGNVLSTGTYVSYQWFFNEVVIPGAQSATYTATNGGGYRVRVVDANGCVDTSAVYNHTLVGIDDVPLAESIKVYPNPARSVLNISAPVNIHIAIYSLDGRLLLQKNDAEHIDISHLSKGMYQVHISDKAGKLMKVEKLTVIKE